MDDKEKEERREDASLEGKGWDILAGGRDNPFLLGGEDPFDQETHPAWEEAAEAPPSAMDAEADEILIGRATSEESLPPEAFWDRGRGGERSEPSPMTGQTPEAPPRDLRPEDLGYRSAAASAPASEGRPLGEPVPAPTPEPPRDLSPEELMPSSMPSAEAPWEMPVEAEEASRELTRELGTETMPPLSEEIIVPTISEEPAPMGEMVPPTPAPAGEPISAPEPEVAGGPIAEPAIPSAVPTPTPPAAPPWEMPSQPEVLAEPFRVYDPFQPGPAPTAIPTAGEELPVDQRIGAMLITPERIRELWDEINRTYNLVINDVRGHFETTEQALNDLKRAREMLLSSPDNFDNAEVLVKEVKARLRLEEKVRKWSTTVGTWLAIYLVAWMVVLFLAAIFTNPVTQAAAQFVPDWMASTYLPGLFGGMGGVVGALWVLIQHTAIKRDFDPIHTRWYITNPFMGFAMGTIVYLFYRGGMLLTVAGTGQQINMDVTSPVLYLLCLAIGFNQNVLWELIDRVIDLIRPPRNTQAATDVPQPSTGEARREE
jgi:hypothetical protein